MPHALFTTITTAALVFTTAMPLCAQSPLHAGVSAGWEFGVPLSLSREAGAVDWCACDGRGTSWNQTFRLNATTLLPHLPWERTAVSARLGIGYAVGRFQSHPYLTDPVLDPLSGAIVTPLVEFIADARPWLVSLDAAVEVPVGQDVAVTLGPWLSLRIASDFTLREHLIAPQSLASGGFTNGERPVGSGDALAADAWSGGLSAGLAWTVGSNRTRQIRVGMAARADAQALAERQGLRALSASIDVALMIPVLDAASHRSEEALPPPTLTPLRRPMARAELTAPRPADAAQGTGPLSASIDIFSIGPNGERMQHALVQPASALMLQQCVLHPFIPFDRGSANLPSRYTLISADRSATHVHDALERPTPVELVYDILNVVGVRMRLHPDESLVIRGSASDDEAPVLALARAEAVAGYLRSVWGIDATRLRVEAGSVAPPVRMPGSVRVDDVRAVELVASPRSALLTPWQSRWDAEDVAITAVHLDPSYTSDKGIARWRITVEQNSREIAVFSSDVTSGREQEDLSVLLRNARSDVPPLHVTFEVTDAVGQTARAYDTLAIESGGDRSGTPDAAVTQIRRKVTTWVVDGSDLTLSQRGRQNRELLRRIVADLSEKATVTIAPLLEGGEGAAFATMQQRREQAQHVASVMMIEAGTRRLAIHLAGGRYTYLPPSGDLPELGFLTRLVAIIVEEDAGD